jgi:hypothetical protein
VRRLARGRCECRRQLQDVRVAELVAAPGRNAPLTWSGGL